MALWVCSVCGYEFSGDSPPDECPRCSSGPGEFSEKTERKRLSYDGKKFDVLLINGSAHRAHNTSLLADTAEDALKKSKVSYRRFNLSELNIQHCWCCYTMKNSACTYPCRNQLDDAPALHKMVVDSKAVIITSPINWNNMPSKLKVFLDRLTCIQNQVLLGKKSLTAGKVVGILINGHEDGALKTAMDIFIYFQQLGYILAPYGFTYSTHGALYDTKEDNEFFKQNQKLKTDAENVVSNVIETMKENLETKLKDKIKPVCE